MKNCSAALPSWYMRRRRCLPLLIASRPLLWINYNKSASIIQMPQVYPPKISFCSSKKQLHQCHGESWSQKGQSCAVTSDPHIPQPGSLKQIFNWQDCRTSWTTAGWAQLKSHTIRTMKIYPLFNLGYHGRSDLLRLLRLPGTRKRHGPSENVFTQAFCITALGYCQWVHALLFGGSVLRCLVSIQKITRTRVVWTPLQLVKIMRKLASIWWHIGCSNS